MTRASFRQADIERIIRAAEKTGAAVQVDLKTLVVTIFPGVVAIPTPASPLALKQDGPEREDWSDIENPLDRGLNAPPEPIQPPFDHREWAIMGRLAGLGVGARLPSGGIRSFGPHTQKKLVDRGYIEVFHQHGKKFADDELCLTQKGMADWKALRKHRDQYPCL